MWQTLKLLYEIKSMKIKYGSCPRSEGGIYIYRDFYAENVSLLERCPHFTESDKWESSFQRPLQDYKVGICIYTLWIRENYIHVVQWGMYVLQSVSCDSYAASSRWQEQRHQCSHAPRCAAEECPVLWNTQYDRHQHYRKGINDMTMYFTLY